jgi:hypothetical protein
MSDLEATCRHLVAECATRIVKNDEQAAMKGELWQITLLSQGLRPPNEK